MLKKKDSFETCNDDYRANLRDAERSNQTEIVRVRLEKLKMMLRNVAVA